MSFFVTPARRAYYVQAIGCFVLALIFTVAAVAYEIMVGLDSLGLGFAAVVVLLCTIGGVLNLRWASKTPSEARVTMVPSLAPVPEQARYFRRYLWRFVFAFPIVIGTVAYDLYQLETGAVKEVSLWAPLVPFYKTFGYWPTLAALMVIGLVTGAVFFVLVRHLESKSTP